MSPLRPTDHRRFLVLSLVLGACGGSTEFHPPAMYTAEQLNAGAVAGLPEEDPASPPPIARPTYGDGATGPMGSPPMSAVRFIHASPGTAASSVDLYADDSATPIATAVAYRSITGAVEVTAAEHAVHIRRAGAAATAAPALTVQTPALEAQRRYTAIAYGLVGGTGPNALAVATDVDAMPAPEAGTAHVRFFHAIVGLGAIDLCRPGTPARPAVVGPAAHPAVAAVPAAALLTNVAYGAFASAEHDGASSHYAHVPAGAPITLQVRAHNAHACTGLLRGTVTLTPADQSVVTAVAVGRVTAPLAARALLLCSDGTFEGAPSCTPVAIR